MSMPASKPKVRHSLAVVELDGEAVVFDAATRRLHHLNPSATLVFHLLDGKATVKQHAARIAEAFVLPADEVEHQIRALVREFRKADLLEGKDTIEGA